MSTTDKQLINLANKLHVRLDAIVFKDQLKELDLPKYASHNIIINMSNHYQPGTHWIALYFDQKKYIYFDSFGVVPPQEVLDYVKDIPVIYNDYQIQDTNHAYCGQWCITFLKYLN